jgi:hypothetical protein
VDEILAERLRQIFGECRTSEQDDKYTNQELLAAACCFATYARERSDLYIEGREQSYRRGVVPQDWPWPTTWWKPHSPKRDLVRAGALIAAELDRYNRLSSKSKTSST